MGSSAMNRNREMGVIIHSPTITQYYLAAWHDDWNRLDNVTDSDRDSLTDKWEVANGLNRTKRVMPSGVTEDMFDSDGDGVNNTDEEKQGSHPLLADTDGDCAIDSVEIAWAQRSALDSSVENIAIYDALNLADADGDGLKDTDVYGCNLALENEIIQPVDNQTIDPDADDDSDGIANKDDLCPDTEPNGLTDDITLLYSFIDGFLLVTIALISPVFDSIDNNANSISLGPIYLEIFWAVFCQSLLIEDLILKKL
mgnify:CR=1 FL=1